MRVRALPPPTLVIVDGSNIAYHAPGFDPFNPAERHTYLLSMLTGFAKIVDATASVRSGPAQVVTVWDSGLAPWRVKMYPEYKAKRAAERAKAGEEDIRRRELRNEAVKLMRFGILPWLGIDQMYGAGPAEGDDLIYHALMALTKTGSFKSVAVVTSDADLGQLVTGLPETLRHNDPFVCRVPPASIFRNGSDAAVFTAEDMRSALRIAPDDYVFVKAVIGDDSDNIPGVGGCGDGTMRKVMDNFNGDVGAFLEANPDDKRVPGRAAPCFTKEGLAIIARNIELMELREPDCAVVYSPGARYANRNKAQEGIALVEGVLLDKQIGLDKVSLARVPLMNFVSWVR